MSSENIIRAYFLRKIFPMGNESYTMEFTTGQKSCKFTIFTTLQIWHLQFFFTTNVVNLAHLLPHLDFWIGVSIQNMYLGPVFCYISLPF